TRHPLCCSNALQESRSIERRDYHIGAWNWRQHGNIQRRQLGAAGAARLLATRRIDLAMDDQSPKQREQFPTAVLLAGFCGLERTKQQLRAIRCYQQRHTQSDRWWRTDPDYRCSGNAESAFRAWAQR